MNINKENIEILKILYNKLINLKDTLWILTGSTALAIQGVDVLANDIDILTDEKGSEQIDLILSEYRIQRPNYSTTEKYRSHFGIYKINNIKVEIMGNFQYKLKNGEWSKPNNPHETKIYDFNEMKIPVLSLEKELQEYENMDRKDKVIKIKEFLDKQNKK